jgi:hypothetical protein
VRYGVGTLAKDHEVAFVDQLFVALVAAEPGWASLFVENA